MNKPLIGDKVKTPDGKIGLLINFRIETNRAVVQFKMEDGKLALESYKYSELEKIPL